MNYQEKNYDISWDLRNFVVGYRLGEVGLGVFYAQFFDPGPKRVPVEFKDGGGAVFPLDLPVGFSEDLKDVLPFRRFKIFKRFLSGFWRLAFEWVRKP